jgi:hypothetical protein
LTLVPLLQQEPQKGQSVGSPARPVSLFFLLDHRRGRCFVWILLGSLLLEVSDGRECRCGVGGGGVLG